jgi:Na+/H+-dicarboxylate symporter
VLDMGRTAVNVAGQALVPTLVAKREKLLDLARYNGPRGLDAPEDDRSEREDRVDLTDREPVGAPA